MRVLHLLLIFPLLGANAQIKPKSVKYDITEATVFLSGAQLKHEAKVTLDAGTNILVFEDLPAMLNKNSIQVKGDNNFTIVNVKHANNHLRNRALSPRITRLNDSIEDLRFKLDMRRAVKTVFEEEKKMILANKEVRGENKGLNVDDLIDLSDFYRERLKDIEMKLLDIKLEEKKLHEQLSRLETSLAELNPSATKSTSEITVEVSTKSKTSAQIELSFLVINAGWIPAYDIRSNGINNPIEITYKARVFQQTGNDWENIKLTLSTGNPTVNNTQPELSPWYLYYYVQSQNKSKALYSQSYQWKAEEKSKDESRKEIPSATSVTRNDLRPASIAESAEFSQTFVTAEFPISMPYTIPANTPPSTVEIQKYKLNSTFKYYAVPKLDKDAFILTDISGWSQYNFLPGDASTYYEGTFVGESFLDPISTSDTLSVSLGRDKGITIERNKVNELCRQSTMGGTKRHSITIEIIVKNNKKDAINIDVYDQIPLSKLKEIESELGNAGGGTYNKETGELKWSLALNPGESKNIRFSYNVKHPRDKVLSNL
ncbi:MAG: mucoidy inhibitor MuiA family protein [Flavobacteriales bacterium]